MKKITALLFTAIIGLIGCSKYEGSTQYTDSHIHKNFVDELNKAGIKFKQEKVQTVLYSASDAKKVSEITKAINAKYFTGCGASFPTTTDREKVMTELSKQGIRYSIVELDAGPTITCAGQDREKFIAIMLACESNKPS